MKGQNLGYGLFGGGGWGVLFFKLVLSFRRKIAISPRMFSSISNSDSLVFINAEICISTVSMFALMGFPLKTLEYLCLFEY